jgi:hypothetical protein
MSGTDADDTAGFLTMSLDRRERAALVKSAALDEAGSLRLMTFPISLPTGLVHKNLPRCGLSQQISDSRSFDHRRRARLPLTAIASAFRCPTRTTRRLPRVDQVSAAASGRSGYHTDPRYPGASVSSVSGSIAKGFQVEFPDKTLLAGRARTCDSEDDGGAAGVDPAP